MKLLTLKVVILLALASPKRVSELAALSIQNLQKGRDRWVFHLGMTKNRRMGGASHSATYERFKTDVNICPISTLETYLEKTDRADRSDRVLLSFTRPFGPVTSQTISRWLKSIISDAGFPSFGAHSTRAASTSTAKAAGISSAQILEAANWAPNGSTFERYYHKGDTVGPSFQSAVLDAG